MPEVTLASDSWKQYPCKLWTGAISGCGYGHHWVTDESGRKRLVRVHREALAASLGRPIKPGYFALHHCDTPTCYEPEHLYEGTQKQNMRDMASRKRQFKQILTVEQCEEIRQRVAAGGVLHRELAAEYGVARVTVTGIVHDRFRPERPDDLPRRDKLTADVVRAIRRRVQAGEVPADLAREYGVGRRQICKVVHRRAWAWVD